MVYHWGVANGTLAGGFLKFSNDLNVDIRGRISSVADNMTIGSILVW